MAVLLEAVLDTTCPRSAEAMLHAVLHILNNSSYAVSLPLNSDADGLRLSSSFSRSGTYVGTLVRTYGEGDTMLVRRLFQTLGFRSKDDEHRSFHHSDESDSTSLNPSLFVNLDLLIAPLTDINYKHLADSLIAAPAAPAAVAPPPPDSSSSLTRAERVTASCHAVSTILRTWPGIAHFCGGGDGTAVKSLVGVLHAPNREMTGSVVDLLFTIFNIPLPPDGEEDLLKAVGFIADPSRFVMRNSWRISAGYVRENFVVNAMNFAGTIVDVL